MHVVNLQVGPGHASDLAKGVAVIHGVVHEIGKYCLQLRQRLNGGSLPRVFVMGQGE